MISVVGSQYSKPATPDAKIKIIRHEKAILKANEHAPLRMCVETSYLSIYTKKLNTQSRETSP
jgi:hypothetical protein